MIIVIVIIISLVMLTDSITNYQGFLSRVSILTCDIDIANLSVHP